MTHKILENWKSKLLYLILSLVIAYLVNFRLESYEKSNTALTESLDNNTVAIGSLGRSMDSLRYNSHYFVDKILDKLGDNKDDIKDHEGRIRDLERK